MKQKVGNFSSVGIIHRAVCPAHVFIEAKTPGYPRKVFVGKCLLPGGNWVGKFALDDASPIGTYRREIGEELSFGNPAVDPNEMSILFGDSHQGFEPKPRDIVATLEDIATLKTIVDAISANARPFGAFFQHTERRLFDMGDPRNTASSYCGVVSVFSVPLPDDEWFALLELQLKYGNLSNESQSIVTSVWEMTKNSIQTAWGQDRVLQKFWGDSGFDKEAAGMSLMPYSTTKEVDFSNTYDDLLRSFDVERVPDGFVRPIETTTA